MGVLSAAKATQLSPGRAPPIGSRGRCSPRYVPPAVPSPPAALHRRHPAGPPLRSWPSRWYPCCYPAGYSSPMGSNKRSGESPCSPPKRRRTAQATPAAKTPASAAGPAAQTPKKQQARRAQPKPATKFVLKPGAAAPELVAFWILQAADVVRRAGYPETARLLPLCMEPYAELSECGGGGSALPCPALSVLPCTTLHACRFGGTRLCWQPQSMHACP